MGKYSAEIVKLRSINILGSMLSLALPFFEASSVYRIPASKFRDELGIDRQMIYDRISYLKRKGYIESFVEGKEKYYEITPKGLAKTNYYLATNPVVQRPDIWDKKWRVVIFDIPNKRKTNRDLFRLKLLEIGFIKVQESVYVYPFECTEIISNLSKVYSLDKNVSVMISEIIQGEATIIEKFIDKEIIQGKDLK